jgi:RimJ/RimL family protein N-acetyltransferase
VEESGLTENQSSGAFELSHEPWSKTDFQLLTLCNSPELTNYVGGSETDEQLIKRHQRYLDGWKTGFASIFRISLPDAPQGVDMVGFWDFTWQGQDVYEAGWTVTADWQDKGIASAAIKLMLDHARKRNGRRLVHAFPTVEHLASNRVCQKTGFIFNEECDFPARNGGTIKCNDWVYDLERDSKRF